MRTIILSGPPGAGKSSVGERLAATLGVPFVDTDALVQARTGRTPAAILREDGEIVFRAHEAEVVRELLAHDAPRVIAFGGGTILDRALRHLALDRALLVTLHAAEATLQARLVGGPERPLAGPKGIGLGRLLELRRAPYAECHLAMATDDLSVDEVVDAIVPWTSRTLVAVPLGERTYSVEIVRHDATRVVDRLAAMGPSAVVAVTDARVKRAQGKLLHAMLDPLNVPHTEVVLAAGEAQKTLGSVGAIWDAALGARVDRDVVMFAFGGGVTLDLAGFAAATLFRGVRWLSAPTTVLAMLDASVGGKTGFDHAAGKNLVGAFHQPAGVVAELASLSTLPERERRAGLAEAVKIALTHDAALFETMEQTAEALREGSEAALVPVLAAAISAKARVVRDDEQEQGDRVLLNFGHTVGHALEAHGNYGRWLHGEAVAAGLVAELRAAEWLGFTPTGIATRAANLLTRLGLVVEVPAAELSGAAPWMATDKKRRVGGLRLPVVTQLGQAHAELVTMDRLVQALKGGR